MQLRLAGADQQVDARSGQVRAGPKIPEPGPGGHERLARPVALFGYPDAIGLAAGQEDPDGRPEPSGRVAHVLSLGIVRRRGT